MAIRYFMVCLETGFGDEILRQHRKVLSTAEYYNVQAKNVDDSFVAYRHKHAKKSEQAAHWKNRFSLYNQRHP